jgi:DnaK suppressor protein
MNNAELVRGLGQRREACGLLSFKAEETTMDALKSVTYSDRLRKRRDEIMTTMQHLDKERRVVDENQDWLDQAAYESRIGLLDRLAAWYLEEIARIDQALIRIAEKKYGICLGCREAIGPERLDITPEAAFCAGCQELREKVAAV